MKIISAVYYDASKGDERDNYRAYSQNLIKSIEKVGHEYKIYELDVDPFDNQCVTDGYSHKLECFFKERIIRQALEELKEDVVWLDTDCLMRERIDGVFDNHDMFFTLRRGHETHDRCIYDGILNAGVMGFAYTPKAFKLLDRWKAKFGQSRSDQDALAYMLIEYSDLKNVGETIAIHGAKAKAQHCNTYNFIYWEDDFKSIDKAKIVHVKGSQRPKYYDRVLAYVLGG